jgi:hypothetical protein
MASSFPCICLAPLTNFTHSLNELQSFTAIEMPAPCACHLPVRLSWKYDSNLGCPSRREPCFRREHFRTEIDGEARMGFVLAHISAEVAEEGDDSTTRLD